MNSVQAKSGGRGLCGETYNFYKQTNSLETWSDTSDGNSKQREQQIERCLAKHAENEWTMWINENSHKNGDYIFLCPPKGKPAEHLSNGTKKEIGLMITARAGACILNGNKTSKSNDSFCKLCDSKSTENEAHILMECEAYNTPRSQLWSTLNRCWTQEQKTHFHSSNPRDRKLILLGMHFPPHITNLISTRRTCDSVEVHNN